MSSELPDQDTESEAGAKPDVQVPPEEQFRSNIADGLHAMAQPVTILQGALCAMTLRSPLSADQQHYHEMSTKQLGRLSEMLHTLQDLVNTSENTLRMVAFGVGELIDRVLVDSETMLLEAGIRIDGPDLTTEEIIHADPGRTERAFRAALRIAASQTEPRESIRLSVCREGESIRVTVKDPAPGRNPLSASDRLNLFLAESNIVSQGGTFEFLAEPLCISFAMQVTHTHPLHNPHADECVTAQGRS
jgi:K+-sensing histidine kinase KdpD